MYINLSPSLLQSVVTIISLACICNIKDGKANLLPPTTRLKFVTFPITPWVTVKNTSNPTQLDGFIPDFVEEFCKEMGIGHNYELHLVPNNSWSNMIEEVVSGESDVVAAPLLLSSRESNRVDFLHPLQKWGLTLLVRKALVDDDLKAVQDASITFGILAPFSLGVWGLLFGTFFLVSVALWLINRFNPREWRGQTNLPGAEDHLRNSFSFTGALWFTFTTLQWQGYDRAPRSLAGRLVTCFWMVYVTLTLTCYTASLINQLWWANQLSSMDTGTAPLHDLAHLVSSGRYHYGVVKKSTVYPFLVGAGANRSDEYAAMKKYWESEEGSKQLVSSYSEGIEKVRNETFVLVMDSLSARWTVNKQPCDLTTVDNFAQRSFGFAIAKNSPFRLQMELAVLRLKEAGTVEALERRHWEDRGACWQEEAARRGDQDSSPQVVTLRLFWGPVVIMAAGLLLGALVAVGEVFYHQKYE